MNHDKSSSTSHGGILASPFSTLKNMTNYEYLNKLTTLTYLYSSNKKFGNSIKPSINISSISRQNSDLKYLYLLSHTSQHRENNSVNHKQNLNNYLNLQLAYNTNTSPLCNDLHLQSNNLTNDKYIKKHPKFKSKSKNVVRRLEQRFKDK